MTDTNELLPAMAGTTATNLCNRRFTDDDLNTIVQDWSTEKMDQATAIGLARNLIEARAEIAALSARASAGEGGEIHQWRAKGSRAWIDCTPEFFLSKQKSLIYETRVLYTAAPQPAKGGAAAAQEWVVVDGRRYDVETVKTALLGLASDLLAAAPQPQNQCDGCRIGDVADAEGFHRSPHMLCQKGRYTTPPAHGVDAWLVEWGGATGTARRAFVKRENADEFVARKLYQSLCRIKPLHLTTRPTPKAEAMDAVDARRYRWLRKQNANLDNPDAWTITSCDFTDKDGPSRYWVGSDLDAAIDAAMSARGEGK